jgi:hypothetical protein
MQRLARKFSADLHFDADDTTGRMVVRAPNAASMWGECFDNATSFATAMIDLQTRVFPRQQRGG